MDRIDDLLRSALKNLPEKPADNAKQSAKKRYSELSSQAIAQAFGEELRQRGLEEARPAAPTEIVVSGAERRMSGGIGAKKVDVTWATEESGLVFATSVKTINFRDSRTLNFQKNLTNRRNDMLYESVTLHRRFPYSVLAGFLFLDQGAASDQTGRRHSTFRNAHTRFRLFTGRRDPAGRDEQYERLYIVLLEANPIKPAWQTFDVGSPDEPVALNQVFDELIELIAERNPDFYEATEGVLRSAR